MKKYKQIGCGTISLPNALFIVFLVLKLTETVDWSWWWVTSPVWIGVFITLVASVLAGLLYMRER